MHQYINPKLDIIKFNIWDVICAPDITAGPVDSERDNAYINAGDLFTDFES